MSQASLRQPALPALAFLWPSGGFSIPSIYGYSTDIGFFQSAYASEVCIVSDTSVPTTYHSVCFLLPNSDC